MGRYLLAAIGVTSSGVELEGHSVGEGVESVVAGGVGIFAIMVEAAAWC
jgi:hypothetical protein